MKRWLLGFAQLLLAGWMAAASSWAQEVLPVPALTGQLMDQAAALNAADQALLSATLNNISLQRGSQVVVLLVPTTGVEPIADYANRVANAWKIGRKDIGDGVLIVAAIQDRKVRIEVARALEGAIPDVTAKRIIREAIVPAFQQTRYAQGINAALHRIDERLAAESLSATSTGRAQDKSQHTSQSASQNTQYDLESLWDALLPIVFVGVIAGLILRRMMGGFGSIVAGAGAGFVAWNAGSVLLFAGGAGLAVWLFSAVLGAMKGLAGAGSRYQGYGGGGGFGQGGFGGGASGGFSSGGGGDFGGGGASGDW